jgi:hypothetical protein
MDLSQYWDRDQLDRIMPTLAELDQEGAVDSAGDWPTLRTEILDKLEGNGTSGPDGDELVEPLDAAVGSGSEFKSLVIEMTKEYEAALQRRAATPPQATSPKEQGEDQATSPEEQKEAADLTAKLPDPEELANQIIMDLGPDIAQLIASDPELAKVSDEDLIQWIVEDVTAAIGEISEYGWEQLG